jgi:hypothetical protein
VHGWPVDGGGEAAQGRHYVLWWGYPRSGLVLATQKVRRTLPYEWAVAPVCGLCRMMLMVLLVGYL